MTNIRLHLLAVASCLVGVSTAAAQGPTFTIAYPATQAHGAGDVMFMSPAPMQGATAGLLAVEPFETARAVRNAPYTADAVTEVTQVLGDGNRIEHRTSVTIARDSRGRIRREHQAMVLGPIVADRAVPLVTISDPSSGTHITVDQERRRATRVRTRGLADARPATLAVPVDAGIVEQGGSARDVRTTDLGERSIEGIRAQGTSATLTIPAGRIGNFAAIEVVSERWYSPELQVVVLTRRTDPRFGETIYRLTNIVRAEPDASLFTVPDGYTVDEPELAPAPPRANTRPRIR